MLAELDLATILPGVRRLDISVGGGGRTGRERISEEDAAARAAARAAAEASPVVLRVLRKFGASLDSVEPLAEAPPAIPAEEPE
jgi:hypothetical protein